MDFFRQKNKDLKKLLKEKEKMQKKVDKELENRLKNKYTEKVLKQNKKILLDSAKEIDMMEYAEFVREIKDKFPEI